jgi:hypothetical protein
LADSVLERAWFAVNACILKPSREIQIVMKRTFNAGALLLLPLAAIHAADVPQVEQSAPAFSLPSHPSARAAWLPARRS